MWEGETSNNNKKNHDAKINYAYANIDNVINMIKPISESVHMMGLNFSEEQSYDTNLGWPMVILRKHN